MSDSIRAEVYFIAAMMILILVISFAAVYLFFRQYRTEKRDREQRRSNRPDRPEDV